MRNKGSRAQNFSDYLNELYNTFPIDLNKHVRDITFQVTDSCCCNCSYCYQINKGNRFMTTETMKACIDTLFTTNNDFINENTFGLILEFIGGEPLLNLPAIDYGCSYFLDTCLKLNHPWVDKWRAFMISNGAKYFETNTQKFIEKFNRFVNFNITLDGPKEIHDACRKYFDGHGNFDDAYAAFKDCQKRFGTYQTKVTLAPETIDKFNIIVDFFIDEGITEIFANPIYEHPWTIQEAQIYYQQLKKMADKLLVNDNCSISLFSADIGYPLAASNLQTWCGGTGKMLAFDPDGNAFPCIRYMESSLGDDQPPIILGNCKDGLLYNQDTKDAYQTLCKVTRKTQSSKKCFDCPIASGCSYCAAWNYQINGNVDTRCTYICNMHQARVLANVYYWNKYYEKNNIEKVFIINLPKDKALKIIDKKEYNMLEDLVKNREKKLL